MDIQSMQLALEVRILLLQVVSNMEWRNTLPQLTPWSLQQKYHS